MRIPGFLSGSGLIWALLLGALALLSVFSYLLQSGRAQPESIGSETPSIYNNSEGGYEGFYETFRKAGIIAMPWRKPYHKLTEIQEPSVLWIDGPENAVSRDDGEARPLLDWVAGGNTLVYMIRPFSKKSSDPFFQSQLAPVLANGPDGLQGGIAVKLFPTAENPVLKGQSRYYTLQIPRDLTPEQKNLRAFLSAPLLTQGTMRLNASETMIGGKILLEDSRHLPVILQFPWGKGNIVLSSVPDLGENRYLFVKNDNYQFLSNLLLATQKPVYFDEFGHGYFESPDMLSYLQKTPLANFFAQCVFLFCLCLWLSFKPWKPPRTLSHESPVHPTLAFVQSLAEIYLRMKASPAVLAPVIQRINQTLLKKYRIHGRDTIPLHQLLQHVTTDPEHAGRLQAETLQAALEKAQRCVQTEELLSPKETFSLIQNLSSLQEGLEHGFRKPASHISRRKNRSVS